MPSGVIAFVNDNSLFMRIWQYLGHIYSFLICLNMELINCIYILLILLLRRTYFSRDCLVKIIFSIVLSILFVCLSICYILEDFIFSGTWQYKLPILGKVKSLQRTWPTANLPSLKSENSPNIPIGTTWASGKQDLISLRQISVV